MKNVIQIFSQKHPTSNQHFKLQNIRQNIQFVIGNKQCEFNRLSYGVSIGPAAFSAFMNKIFRLLTLNKKAITNLDDVYMQSQTKDELSTVFEKYNQILQENMKVAPDKSHFFLTRKKFLGHIIERNTITPQKPRMNAIQKLQPPSNKKKIQEFFGMLNFLSKYVNKLQLYFTPFYNILRQQNNFEWTTEHQTRFEEIKLFSPKNYQTLFQIPINHFMLCATPPISASAQHYYNLTMEQIKRISFQQILDYLHKLNLDALPL